MYDGTLKSAAMHTNEILSSKKHVHSADGKNILLLGDATLDYLSAVLSRFLTEIEFPVGKCECMHAQTWDDENLLANCVGYDLVIVFPISRNFSLCFPETNSQQDNINLALRSLRLKLNFLSQNNSNIIVVTPPIENLLTDTQFQTSDMDLGDNTDRIFYDRFTKDFKQYNLFDINALIYQIGAKNYFDNKNWYRSRLICSIEQIPVLSHFLVRRILQIFQKNTRLMILDFDNTLWGGAIGDLGPNGVIVGKDFGIKGEKFFNFQLLLKKYKENGIILIGLTKNDPEIIDQEFDLIPGSVLKKEDFLTIYASWNSKSDAISDIRSLSNVSLDTMLFIDDNKFERAEVSSKYPELKIFNANFEEYTIDRSLALSAFTDFGKVTAEDKNRLRSLRTRKTLNDAAGSDVEELLQSMNMVGSSELINMSNYDRAQQLLMKTNQFELSGIRSLPEKQYIQDHVDIIRIYRLKDDLVDHGITSVVIMANEGDELIVKNWVMSCRVFGRKFEHWILGDIIALAQEKKVTKIKVISRETSRNKPAFTFLQSVGLSNETTEVNSIACNLAKFKINIKEQ